MGALLAFHRLRAKVQSQSPGVDAATHPVMHRAAKNRPALNAKKINAYNETGGRTRLNSFTYTHVPCVPSASPSELICLAGSSPQAASVLPLNVKVWCVLNIYAQNSWVRKHSKSGFPPALPVWFKLELSSHVTWVRFIARCFFLNYGTSKPWLLFVRYL